jgi:uncharacterized membrane protein YeaQ/YmgE (transglycosylase-associated protein family)
MWRETPSSLGLRMRLLVRRLGYASRTRRTLEAEMTVTGIVSAILIGIVVGVLGRLVLPGRQPIGMLVTVLVGIVSAFIGTAIARALGIPTATSGVDWLELLVQVIVAALGVALVASLMGRRRGGLMGGRRSRLLR